MRPSAIVLALIVPACQPRTESGAPDTAVPSEDSGSFDVSSGQPIEPSYCRFRGSSLYKPPHTEALASSLPPLERYPLGSAWPTALARGDIDGDGLDDLVYADIADQMSVLLSVDGYRWNPAHTVGVRGPATSVVLANVVGDARLEAIVADRGGGRAGVYTMRRDGGLALTASIDLGADVGDVAVGDLNADGRPDLVLAATGWSSVAVALAAADGMFHPPRLFACGSSPTRIQLIDFDRDGLLDVVVGSGYSEVISLLRGDGKGSLGPPASVPWGECMSNVQLVDLDGDGMSEWLGVGDRLQETRVLATSTGTGFVLPTKLASPVASDFNGDGKLDLVGTDSLSTWFVAGMGKFSFAPGVQAFDGYFVPMTALDVDGDGQLDLIGRGGTDRAISSSAGDGAGQFKMPRPLTPSIEPESLFVADLDGDGRPEWLVIGTEDGLPALLVVKRSSTGAITIARYPRLSTESGVLVGDVDRDGRKDVVLVDPYGKSGGAWMRGLGDATLGAAESLKVSSWYPRAVADLDGDGKEDVIGQGTGCASVAYDIAALSTTASIGNGSFVGVVDLDGDGRLEVACVSEGNLAIYRRTEGRTFVLASSTAIRAGFSAIKFGDVDGDGFVDALVDGYAGTDVLPGRAGATFGTTVALGALSPNSMRLLGDVDGDGRADLIDAPFDEAIVYVFKGLRPLGFAPRVAYPMPHAAHRIVVGDSDGDGRADMLVLDRVGRALLLQRSAP